MSEGREPSLAARAGRFLATTGRRFYGDQCLVRASALAYVSLLSIVPVLAVMFSVLKGLGSRGALQSMLLSRLSLRPEVTETLVGFVDRISIGTLGGIGASMLLVTVVGLIGGIESSLNLIWRVRRDRTPWRMVTDYLGVVLLTPFLLLAAVALTSSMQVQWVLDWMLGSPYLGIAAVQALRLAPIVINIIAIGVLYTIIPNRRPSPVPVAIGAAVAGAGWHLVQVAYIQFQIGMASYGAIYGALSQLPITLVWLYLSWAVVLFGAEVAAVCEFGWEHSDGEPTVPNGVAVALHMLVAAADSFRDGGKRGVDLFATARQLGVTGDVVAAAATHLESHGWLVAVEEEPPCLVLARDPKAISLGELTDLRPAEIVPPGCDPRVRAALDALGAEERDLWRGRTLADLLGD